MLSKEILIELQEYIQNHKLSLIFDVCEAPKYCEKEAFLDITTDEIENFIKKNRKPTLNQVLFSYIDKKGVSDTEVYKKAGIDRRHFSKIRSNPNYRPGKNTTIALAFALELNQDDTHNLLSSAGYTLSDSETSDLVILFCLEKKIYDIDLVNQALDYFSLKPLIGVI